MRSAVWLGLSLGLLASGCQSYDALCEARTTCLGGNELDMKACVVALEREAERADDVGCGEHHDLATQCAEVESECFPMNGLFTSEGRCDDLHRRYEACMESERWFSGGLR